MAKATPTDLHGRPWALKSQVKPGMQLRCDGDFICLRKNTRRRVRKEPNGTLYVRCSHGKHFLDGQEKRNGNGPTYYLGLYLEHS